VLVVLRSMDRKWPRSILEAWQLLQPRHGLAVKESRLPEMLQAIVALIPRSAPKEVKELCGCFGGDTSIVVEMLRPIDGKIYFLYFWRAVTVLSSVNCFKGKRGSDSAMAEINGVRDFVLEHFETACLDLSSARMMRSYLVEEVRCVATASLHRAFWGEVLAALEEKPTPLLTFQDTTQILTLCLRNASALDVRPRIPPLAAHRGHRVKLHIYDVSQVSGIQALNKLLAHQWNPFKLGGVFHAGIEVGGTEWGYGYQPDESRPGVSCCLPRKHTQHHYRQTVVLRRTRLNRDQINGVILQLIEDYPGDDYDLLHRNCCHFADDFCKRLHVGRLPGWVYRFARIGCAVDSMFGVSKVLDLEGS